MSKQDENMHITILLKNYKFFIKEINYLGSVTPLALKVIKKVT